MKDTVTKKIALEVGVSSVPQNSRKFIILIRNIELGNSYN